MHRDEIPLTRRDFIQRYFEALRTKRPHDRASRALPRDLRRRRCAPDRHRVALPRACRARQGRARSGDAVPRGRSSACSPAATCCSKACPASARRCSCARSPTALELAFSRIQFTPDLMPARHRRHQRADRARRRGERRFEFQPGRSSRTSCSPTRSTARRRRRSRALLEAMQEHAVTVAGDAARARRAVLRARDAEPDRDGGHVSAARGAARPLPVQGCCVDCPTARTLRVDPRRDDRRRRRPSAGA